MDCLPVKGKEEENPVLPALLICPTSVLGNWQKELARFAPDLKIRLHYGPQRPKGADFLPSIQGAGVVLTSYNLAHIDEAELSMVDWDCICLDEAQNIKNAYQTGRSDQETEDATASHDRNADGNRLTELCPSTTLSTLLASGAAGSSAANSSV